MDKKTYSPILAFLFCLCLTSQLQAQFTVSGQIRTRTEFRDGQGTPSVRDTVPAIFTSQRTRINFGYSGYRFKLYASLQDVRVWGQDASSINRINNDAYHGFLVQDVWGGIRVVA